MQFQIPQFIETEDKIIGPLTLKQFIYVAIAFGILFSLFFILKTAVWMIVAVPIGGFSVALAFVKVEGRPLANVMVSIFHFYWHPQQYAWQPEEHKPEPASEVETAQDGPSLEKIVAGFALKRAWRAVQTGSKEPDIKLPVQKSSTERYEVFRRATGEKRAARRVDYR